MHPITRPSNCGESAIIKPIEFERFRLRLGSNSLEFEGISDAEGIPACSRWSSEARATPPVTVGPGANPEGWQMVAGGRSGQGGNNHRKSCFGLAHPGGVPEPRSHDRSIQVTTAKPFTLAHPARSPRSEYLGSISIRLGSEESGTPCRGAGFLLRRCPEVAAAKNPRRPPATLWQPFGLTNPESPNSRVVLRGRTKEFALRIIRMFVALPKTDVARVLGRQVPFIIQNSSLC
jgi:hypothetical protein